MYSSNQQARSWLGNRRAATVDRCYKTKARSRKTLKRAFEINPGDFLSRHVGISRPSTIGSNSGVPSGASPLGWKQA